ncbi:RDD family protein [Nonomuraea sp. NPDC050643]|uniref:RDD family protein n=1 Tax=Nonomuraea sp. NPDC050643 TaxID=3155660 RepID=UPI0033F40F6D
MVNATPHTVRLWIAPRSARFAAFFIDLLLWALLAIWIEAAADPFLQEGEELVVLVPEFLYYWLLHARYGQTLGKALLGIKVVARATGNPPSFRESAVRAGFYLMVPLLPLVGWIVALANGLHIFRDRRHRCYHDRLADTVVVSVPPKAAG